jgi:LuxR family transcriptional regulator, maltose regulon positive regulatory protein
MSRNSSVFMATKLYLPVIRSVLIKRSRLVERLQVGTKRRLSLVIAPAGYGKTTLLGEWLASIAGTSWRVAWVSLDEYDNEPARFWGYVIEALGAVHSPILIVQNAQKWAILV